jgi:nitroreductase
MLLDLILKRRSVRKYLSRPISKEDLLKCIEAARLAPSAQNAQPWRFIIVDQPELKDKICQRAFSGVYAANKFAITAPVLIVVVSEKENFLRTVTKYFRGTNYYLIDIGIACEHLCLEATELGIGSCWIGWFNEKAVKETLHIPQDKKIDIVISLGYFIEDKLKKKSRKSLEEMSSFNVYK